jgi:predicted nucleic acid-binding protein
MEQEKGIPADASSLIYIAKCDAFREMARCVPLVLVPLAVWEEAVEAGDRIGAPEVGRIKQASRVGLLERVDLSAGEIRVAHTLAETHRVGRGESEVLVLGKRHGRCIVDEGRASRVALSMGITPIPTLLLPVLGYRSGAIGRRGALDLIRRLAVVAGAKAEVVFAIEAELSGGG